MHFTSQIDLGHIISLLIFISTVAAAYFAFRTKTETRLAVHGQALQKLCATPEDMAVVKEQMTSIKNTLQGIDGMNVRLVLVEERTERIEDSLGRVIDTIEGIRDTREKSKTGRRGNGKALSPSIHG